MRVVTRGFAGRRRYGPDLPPGQYLTEDFPVLSAGPTPRLDLDGWELFVATEAGARQTWSWPRFRAMPTEEFTVDIHCVTCWSKLGTTWEGVPVDALLVDVPTIAEFALVHSYGGYTTNLPLADLRDGRAWIAFRYDGADLDPEHGGPARRSPGAATTTTAWTWRTPTAGSCRRAGRARRRGWTATCSRPAGGRPTGSRPATYAAPRAS